MKQQVFYIHGGESYSDYEKYIEQLRSREIWDLPLLERKGKWTDTLPTDLGSDFEVFMPLMPNKQNAKFEEWKIWFERHFEHLHDGLILMGCSLGAMFLYKYLSEHDMPIKLKALILMASPALFTDAEFAHDCGDFTFTLDAVAKIADKADRLIIMHSKDDFLVPYEHGVKLSETLPNAEFITYEDKNHFLIQEFPELISKIKELA